MRYQTIKRIVIVDGYSTGRDLVAELLDHGVECLHLQSSEQLPAPVAKSFDPRPYDADLGYAGGPNDAAALLRRLHVDAVIAGSEWGVTFAEQVAHRLGLPTNRMDCITARRDKYEMIETLRRHGLHAAEQTIVTTRDAAHAWADSHGQWPVVIKPLDSAGSDGVTICANHDDIDRAFTSTFGRRNFMGSQNDRLLLQSYLSGPQFIVNSVSRDGQHYITDIWSQTTSTVDTGVVPGGIHLVDPTEPVAVALMDYTRKALDALGIENGAAHSELKWTPDGPALIETGARPMGAAMDSSPYRTAGLVSQAMAYAHLLTASPAECAVMMKRRHYAMPRHMTKLLFKFDGAGTVTATDGLRKLAKLPSFHEHVRALPVGGKVWKTADWLCCGGIVYLIHEDPAQIESDIQQIRTWEKAGELYTIAPAQVPAEV